MTAIKAIELNQFRNHSNLQLSGLDSACVALIGQNGAGKTNIMEAVSLLCPGRGLRGQAIFQ
jgi:DNA replication and repair protein RecF